MLTHHLATAPATPPVLVRALVDHARTTADIGLARALASHPNLDLGDAAQLLADLNIPVRQQAALDRTASEGPTGATAISSDLIRGGDPDLAVALTIRHPRSAYTHILNREDLTPEHLDQILNAPDLPTPAAQTLMVWTMCHPVATADQRAAAWAKYTAVGRSTGPGGLRDLADLLTAGKAPQAIPLPALRAANTHTGATRLVVNVLTRHLPADMDDDTATALVHVLPTFPGSTTDLVTTLETITRI